MDRKAELRLPTVSLRVRVALVGRGEVDAELFVADGPRSGRAELLDDLADMLDQPARFVPVRSGDIVRLYAKDAIAWIAVQRRGEEIELEETASELLTLYDRQHRVEVEMVAGGRLSGTLFDSSPADRPRVIDHLNAMGRFVRLWTPDDHYLINKDQILHVSEHD